MSIFCRAVESQIYSLLEIKVFCNARASRDALQSKFTLFVVRDAKELNK